MSARQRHVMFQSGMSPVAAPIVTAPPPAGSLITSFTLTTSAASGTYPFTLGIGFKKGDAPSDVATDLANAQVIVKRRWSDGSVKHAVVSGRAALAQNIAREFELSTGTQVGGAALSASNIQAAAPTASVQCGALGTVNLPSLLAAPVRTWVSGSELVECHYRGDVGGGTRLAVLFRVRLFADGRMWVRAKVENGYVDGVNSDQAYVPTAIIGGTTVYTNGGLSLTHYQNTSWFAEGWIGGDPQITPKHDVAYLRAAKFFPNYFKTNPSSAAFGSLVQSYTPMSKGNLEASMGSAGFQPSLGLLPLWDALYVTSGDARAYRAMMANALHLNSYGIGWRDSVTQKPMKPSQWPNVALEGGSFNVGRGGLTFEVNHMPSEGYAAYLFSGDYDAYETLLNTVATCYGILGTPRGLGLNRTLSAEERGTAWMLRSCGQVCAIAPDDDDVADEYRTLLQNNYTYWQGIKNTAGMNELGVPYCYAFGSVVFGDTMIGAMAPWEHDFWSMTNGHLSDIEAITTAAFTEVRNWQFRFQVGRLGLSGVATEFDFTRGKQHHISVSSSDVNDATTFFDVFGDVHTATHGSPNTAASNTLTGTSGGDPALPNGYWGNLMPAIAYAVDYGAAGAQAAWNRFVGATNWPTLRDSGFDDNPVWGIAPRGGWTPPYALPGIGEVVAIGTNNAMDIVPSVAQGMVSTGMWNYSLFFSYGGGAFVEDYSAGGAFVIASSGGHTAPENPGAAIFDFADATWKRKEAIGGSNLYHSPNSWSVSDTGGSPNYELNGTAIPAPAHLGQQLVAVPKAWDASVRGGVLRLAAMAMCQESVNTRVVHKFDLETGLYSRPAVNAFARGTPVYGVGLLDVARMRWWHLSGDENNWTSLEYLDVNDWTVKSSSTYGFPPDLWAQGGAFMHAGLIIRNGAPGSGSKGLACWDPSTPTTTPFLLNVDNAANLNPTYHCAYVGFKGKYYSIPELAGESTNYALLYRLTPPASSPKTNQWIADTVAIPTLPRAAGSPGNATGNMSHNRLFYVPAIDRLAWIPGYTESVYLLYPT